MIIKKDRNIFSDECMPKAIHWLLGRCTATRSLDLYKESRSLLLLINMTLTSMSCTTKLFTKQSLYA